MGKPKPERDQRVIQRFQEGASLGIIGKEFGITREWARQIVQRALPGRYFGRELTEDLKERTVLPEALLAQVARAEISWSDFVRQTGISQTWASVLLRRHGCKPTFRQKRCNDAAALAEEIYDLFVNHGFDRYDLAEFYKMSPGSISQYVLRHRRRTGAPGKRECLRNLRPDSQAG